MIRSTYLLVGLAVCLLGCTAGNGDGLDISGRPLSEGGAVALAPTLESIQSNVFNPFCITCHAGANAPQGLRLDAINSFTNLVGVPSSEVSLLRVQPGNPDASYLIQKLEGTASVGGQMPLGGPPIPQVTIDFVRQWIVDGALPVPGPGAGDTAPTVISFTPGPDSTLDRLPQQVLASFSQDIDASTVNSMTVLMIRSGGDNGFGEGNEQDVQGATASLSVNNQRLAIFDLTGVAAIEDRYRIILKGSGPNVILGVNGVSLDGEFTGQLPSGDGAEGGDFVAEFQLQGLQPTLQSIQDNVFTPVCSVCHTGPEGSNLPSGQDLSSAQASFASLVGVASLEEPQILRVAAGDSDNSYLVQKLEGTAASGDQMPVGGPFLDQASLDVIRSWIDQGASP